MTVLAETSQAPLWRDKLGPRTPAVVYELGRCVGAGGVNLAGSGESRGYEA